MPTLYCARWILPVTAPATVDAAIAVENDRIVSVGARSVLAAQFPHFETRQFGNAAIIPGLINTHSHLELTVMRGFLEDAEHDFFAWLKKLTVARMQKMTADDLYVSASWGACEAVRAGVTCVGDASSSAGNSIEALRDVGLAGIVFQESFGPDPRLANENFERLTTEIAILRERETALAKVGVSPHAPYTVSARQLQLISRFAIDEALPLSIHAAESEMEVLLLRDGTGPLAEGLKRRGIEWKPPRVSPIKYLKDNDVLATQPLLAHCVHVDDSDIELIKASNARVAHCPKSNAKLAHGVAPFSKFVKRNVCVGFGSDSVASNNLCDILDEARFALLTSRTRGEGEAEKFLSAEDALNVATHGAAQAMGFENEIGELRAGLRADFAVVSLANAQQVPTYDVASTLIFSSWGRDVVLTVVGGKEVYREGKVTTVDEERLLARMNEIAEKLVR